MLQRQGDIWEFRGPSDWVVITVNSTLRKDGGLVMGRGIALEASQRYPKLQAIAGRLIRQNGSRVETLISEKLILFPVKGHYRDHADINLILKSTLQLLEIFNSHGWEDSRILLPRVGCGWGHLDWAEVHPLLVHYLTEDRFIVFHKTSMRTYA